MSIPHAIDCHVPTGKMRKLKKPKDELSRLTSYYEDSGQLHWWFGRGVETRTAYFIQARDRQMFVVIEPDDKSCTDELLAQHLDANMTADVIKCRVPTHMAHFYEHKELGLTLFLTHFHPSPKIRSNISIYIWGSHLHSLVFKK